MAYDEDLADRVRALLESEDGISEKRMFGGLAFLVGGNMAVAAGGGGGAMSDLDDLEPGDKQDIYDSAYNRIGSWSVTADGE